MLSARICISIAIAAAVVSCHRLSPEEEKVVGTWEFSEFAFKNRVVFHPDHTSEELYVRDSGAKIPSWAVRSRGTWKLEGDTIVTDKKPVLAPPRGEPPYPRRVVRTKILAFRPDELVREGNRSPFKRVK